MDPTRIAVFDLAERRLAWTERRQALLARNIANATTPAFHPSDMVPFAQSLARATNVGPVQTNPGHMAGTQDATSQAQARSHPNARAPDGNTVALDEQLTKVADTETIQALTTAVYKRYMGMFSLALGRSQ
jgi:flagellar basal-body rod protein FlgB